MSVCVKNIYLPSRLKTHYGTFNVVELETKKTGDKKALYKSYKAHIFDDDVTAVIDIEKNGRIYPFTITIQKGFKCDGASIPILFRWFLPSWAECETPNPFQVTWADKYNIGSAIHDGLYIHKGFGIFTREECDDILRGIWRCSGISRFKAGVADKAVEIFAGGSEHWGNDSYRVGRFFNIR